MLSCDFFIVETALLKRLYVLFFVELASRRVHFAGVTANPNGASAAQQARNVVIRWQDTGTPLGFVIHDRDGKFSGAFDAVVEAEGIEVVRTLVPNANAIAERWVGSARRECLDRMLILSRRHAEATLCEHTEHFNSHRPHRALATEAPVPRPRLRVVGKDPPSVRRRDVLGGLIHEYEIAA
ncbi:MAG TPA: integrase core domain-containing protein [Solirubrobacteraceae bacterium]|nr:integrase core domain-containing protein [Solirubrobacteraceae bacterium]